MEALEKDFEDFVDSEEDEDVLVEDEKNEASDTEIEDEKVIQEDDNDEDLDAVITDALVNLAFDLQVNVDDVELTIDEDGKLIWEFDSETGFLLDEESEDISEIVKKKMQKLSKRVKDAGGAAAYSKKKKERAKDYIKNRAKVLRASSKRRKKGKKPKFQYTSFEPYLDSDGKEVQLSSYDATEDVGALVGDSELSEEFKTKATTIFEAAVTRQVDVHLEHLKDVYKTQLTESVESASDELVGKIDSYLDYVASNWLDQNMIAVDSGSKVEINESFISEMKKVFDSHYIDIPDAKVDVVNDLSARLGELESRLDDELSANVSLKKEITEHKKNEAIQALSGGLTDTDLEKLRELSRSVEYDGNVEEFESKLKVIKEQYFPSTTGKIQQSVVTEETEESIGQNSSVMDMYTSTLSRTVKSQ